MIEGLFQQLGFNSNEIKIYLGLAEVGRAPAQALARRIKLPRTTVYSVLDNLVQRGLVSTDRKGAATFYAVNKPSALLRLLDRERQTLTEKERALKELVSVIEPYFRSQHFSIPKLKFFDGNENVKAMLYDFHRVWSESMKLRDATPSQLTNWGYQDHTFVLHYRQWLEDSWKLRPPPDTICLISNDAHVEDELKGKVPGREIKRVPAQYDFSSTIWVWGDYIILIMTRQEPHYAFQLHDAVFAANLRLVFMLLWEKL